MIVIVMAIVGVTLVTRLFCSDDHCGGHYECNPGDDCRDGNSICRGCAVYNGCVCDTGGCSDREDRCSSSGLIGG